MIGDIQTASGSIVLMAFLSLVLGFAFLIFLRFAVGIIVWASVFAVLVLLLCGGAYGFVMSSCGEDAWFPGFVGGTNSTDDGAAGAGGGSGGGTPTSVNGTELDVNATRRLFPDLLLQKSASSDLDGFFVPPPHMRRNLLLTNGSANNETVNGTAITPDETTAASGASVLESLQGLHSSYYEDCMQADPKTRDFYKGIAILMFVLAGAYACLVFVFRNNIRLGIAINKVAAKFVYQVGCAGHQSSTREQGEVSYYQVGDDLSGSLKRRICYFSGLAWWLD